MRNSKIRTYVTVNLILIVIVIIMLSHSVSPLNELKPISKQDIVVTDTLIKIPLVQKRTLLGDTISCYTYNNVIIIEFGYLTTDDLFKVQKFFENYE